MDSKEYTKCILPDCPRRHSYYRLADLAQQYDVSYDYLYRQLPTIDVIKVGREYRIPECQVPRLFDVVEAV